MYLQDCLTTVEKVSGNFVFRPQDKKESDFGLIAIQEFFFFAL